MIPSPPCAQRALLPVAEHLLSYLSARELSTVSGVSREWRRAVGRFRHWPSVVAREIGVELRLAGPLLGEIEAEERGAGDDDDTHADGESMAVQSRLRYLLFHANPQRNAELGTKLLEDLRPHHSRIDGSRDADCKALASLVLDVARKLSPEGTKAALIRAPDLTDEVQLRVLLDAAKEYEEGSYIVIYYSGSREPLKKNRLWTLTRCFQRVGSVHIKISRRRRSVSTTRRVTVLSNDANAIKNSPWLARRPLATLVTLHARGTVQSDFLEHLDNLPVLQVG